ncbi:hypothetical protein AwWohl_01370 [Gammaproteobacteria bacterium]|nr:hypothetical protein AwWohl_01370 [Gammaproteobacteria bacterium]
MTQWFKQTWVSQYLFSPITGQELGFLSNIKAVIGLFLSYLYAAGFVILTAIMRVIIFFLSLPWFVLCALVGIVDGFIEREVRKFEGGIEHALLYHIAKSHLPLAISIAWIAYIGMPFSIHPSFILVPAGVFFGINLYITTWSFKKFL